jgi:hypothetical protein
MDLLLNLMFAGGILLLVLIVAWGFLQPMPAPRKRKHLTQDEIEELLKLSDIES